MSKSLFGALAVSSVLAVAASAQVGALFKDQAAEALFRASRAAVGHGEGRVLALKTMVLKGRARVVLGDRPAVEGPVEIRIMLPDAYLRVDGTSRSSMRTGFSGKKLLTAIEENGQTSAPPEQLRSALLKVERARAARLLLGAAVYVSPEYFVTFRSVSAPQQLAGPLDAPAGTVVASGRQDPSVIEGSARDGFFVRLHVDAARLPTQLEYRTVKDKMNITTFADRRDVDGLQLPFRITTLDGKRAIDELVLDSIAVNVPLTAADFERAR